MEWPPPRPRALLDWYDKNRRLLPWRALPGEQADPYRVWLSEIMLQQTTVATVGPYFRKFVALWPTLQDLAAAPLDDILRQWAGLGYYRRARMLHQCARLLISDYGGIFPRDISGLQALPGFGPYTAAAVASIAFDLPANVVDGNVERVIARIFALRDPMPGSKPALRAAAGGLAPTNRAGDYAQALMDLGATICTPRSPKCGLCPWSGACQALALGIQDSLPTRAPKKPKPVRRTLAFVLLNDNGEVFLRSRPGRGLLAGMMEVPSAPWLANLTPKLEDAVLHAPVKARWRPIPDHITHIFTHFTLEASVVVATTTRKVAGAGVWVPQERLDKEALPTVMKKIINHAVKTR
jgi:A/G-specific adenine glycosylase